MNSPIIYPLEEVLQIKKRRVTEAEQEVARCQKKLDDEKKTLKQKEDERDEVQRHKEEKIAQFYAELDEGTTSDKIIQAKRYLETVQERLMEKQKAVDKQVEQVEEAKKNLEAAKELLAKRRKEVDKFNSHREDWMKEARRELEIVEGREQDELGSLIYLNRKLRGY
ncbi:MAG: YscO family type III secretion system apparatus protein [Chlamydiia bacterium]|nr:YscO family type III secretion system apparatus protein [Chlamydiia bacterium]